jgi:hypothetical protein
MFRLMKRVAHAGFVLVVCVGAALRADSPPGPLIVPVPFYIEADGDPVATAVQFPLPVIPIDKDRDAFMQAAPGDADDAALIGYLQSLKNGDKAGRLKYLAKKEASDSGGTFQLDATITGVETMSFFPKHTGVHILGKIPVENGAAYIILVRKHKSHLAYAFITEVLAERGGAPQVYMQNPWSFVNDFDDSCSASNVDGFFKNGTPGTPGQVLSKQSVADFLLARANPSTAGDILKAIDHFQTHAGKDSFTNGRDNGLDTSQQNFDKELAELKPAKRTAEIEKYAAAARKIAYILDFNPVYITVQKIDHAPDLIWQSAFSDEDTMFYYLRGKDGRLRFTNGDALINSDLPTPPAAVTQACATALQAAEAQE